MGSIYYPIRKDEKGEGYKMQPKTVSGDVDDLIFGDCDWHPSER